MSKKPDVTDNLESFGEKRQIASSVPSSDTPEETAAVQLEGKRKAGRPKVHGSSMERTSITLDPIVMGKLRMLCLEQGRQLRDVIEESLLKYFEEFEKEHGTIRVPALYRNKE